MYHRPPHVIDQMLRQTMEARCVRRQLQITGEIEQSFR